MPNLIEVQKHSYDQFVRLGADEKERLESGLEKVLKSIFPISDFSNTSSLQYIKYTLDEPKYDVEECRQRGMTFSVIAFQVLGDEGMALFIGNLIVPIVPQSRLEDDEF
ncbi:MAG: hypothetical protein V3R64_03970, partial [Sphingomonadales bacterium]